MVNELIFIRINNCEQIKSETQEHGLLSEPCMKNITGPGVLLEGTLEQLHDCSFLSPYPQASYHGKVSEKKTSIGYFFLRDT